MKRFIEVLDDIQSTNAEISRTGEEARKTSDTIRDYLRSTTETHMKPDAAKVQEIEMHLCKLGARENSLRLSLPYMKQNARAALYHENIQKILDIWNGYQGKPYGPKTKEKIREEIKAATGCGFHVTATEYRQELSFYALTSDGYSMFSGSEYNVVLCTKYIDGVQVPILSGNRVQLLTVDSFNYIPAYVEDIPAAVERAKELYKKAHEAYTAYEAALRAYNAVAASGLPAGQTTMYYDTLTF